MADFDLPSCGVERESVPRPTRVRFCDSQFLDPHNGAYPLLSHVLDLVSSGTKPTWCSILFFTLRYLMK